jgi:hypothetical protein
MSTPGSADAGNAGDGGGTNVLMKHVAPALGVIVATMLFASPVTVVRAVRQQRQLGVRRLLCTLAAQHADPT